LPEALALHSPACNGYFRRFTTSAADLLKADRQTAKRESMKMNYRMAPAIAAGAFVALLTAPTMSAQPAVPSPELTRGGNLWSVTAFEDPSPAHAQMATQNICFEFIGVVGTHNRYRWRSTTFPDWNGIASQEGDQVFMHGDYAQDVGHDGMMWTIDTSRSGSGHWTEWRENGGFGNTIGFANATFQRIGTCPGTSTPLPFIPQPRYPDGTLQLDPIGRPTLKQPQ
jgi:hypothetical protein